MTEPEVALDQTGLQTPSFDDGHLVEKLRREREARMQKMLALRSLRLAKEKEQAAQAEGRFTALSG